MTQSIARAFAKIRSQPSTLRPISFTRRSPRHSRQPRRQGKDLLLAGDG
jgi:hypothetical protein